MVNRYNLSIVQKICLAAMFIVLAAICQKVLAFSNFAPIPFLRISFGGPAIIIFASIILGPIFGALVGGASDLIGFVIFDPKTTSSIPFFQITLLYVLLGFVSYFIFKYIQIFKNKKAILITETATFSSIFLAVILYIFLNDNITIYGKTYEFTTTIRICTSIITFILLLGLFIINLLLSKKIEKRHNDISVYHVSFACFITEFLIMLLFGTAMKVWAFSSATFLPVFFTQLIVCFFNVPLNTLIISYIMILSDKVLKRNLWLKK